MPQNIQTLHGNCLVLMPGLPAESISSIVTDPPYGLKFMGKNWDHGIPGIPYWTEALRVAKPGAYLLAFGGTRTFHRLMVAIEDAGWEIRDTIMWVYAQGFPKGHDIAWEMHKNACVACGVMVEYDHDNQQAEGSLPQAEHDLRFVRASYLQTPVYACAECGQILQPFLSKQEAQELRTTWSNSKVVWPQESSMEGRRDMEAPEGKLQRCQVCEMSHGIFADGAEGWIRHGAQARDGEIPWQVANANGSRPSYRPQSIEQFHRKSDAFFIERRAQESRGWNVALKPAWEPIIVARKPLVGTVAQNVQKYGTGAMNIDACRVPSEDNLIGGAYAQNGTDRHDGTENWRFKHGGAGEFVQPLGRWPANLIHDGSDEAIEPFPLTDPSWAGVRGGRNPNPMDWGGDRPDADKVHGHDDLGGSAARFFYTAKAGTKEKGKDNKHPTVKPLALMEYLCKLVTPPGGTILDCFAGSGTTGIAAFNMGFDFIGMELDEESAEMAGKRLKRENDKMPLFRHL